MITDYNIYNRYKSIYFHINIFFELNINNLCNITYNIFAKKYSKKYDVEKLNLNIKSIFNEKFNKKDIISRNYIITTDEAIYLYLKLQTLKYDEFNYKNSLYDYFSRKIENSGLGFSKYLKLDNFEDDFNQISLKQEDIDNFYIEEINKNIKLFYDDLYKFTISDNVKNHFKYLDDSKKFDLI